MDKPKLTLYNPAELEKEDLISSFVVRQKPFNDIMAEIRGQKPKSSVQHYLIVGQRGMGKTTLLYRIKYEIENDSKLNDTIIPVSFSEEQHNIIDLGDVWLSVARSLEQSHPDQFKELLTEIEQHDADVDFSSIAYGLLIDSLKKHNKNLVLLVDNMGLLLSSIEDQQAQRLREILMTEKRIRLVGASSYVLEHSFEYKSSFFEFFKQIKLEGLTSEETLDILRKLAEIQGQKEKIEDIIKTQPQRIETIRRLTGGVIRTIVLLFEILADSENGKVLTDLEAVIDRVTPLYQHRMELLKPQQKQIVDVIARAWDAVTTGEIAQEGRIARQGIQSNQISSQLKQLIDNQIIEEVDVKGKRNKLYRIRERFFNIWYLMRSTRKHDRQRVIWLIRFFEGWCTPEQLAEMAKCQMDGYKSGTYSHSSAYMRALAILSVPGLDPIVRHEFLEDSIQHFDGNQAYVEGMKKLFVNEYKNIDIVNKSYKYFGTKDLEQIKQIVDKELINGNSNGAYNLANLLLFKYNELDSVESYLLSASKLKNKHAMFQLGMLYFFYMNNLKAAEKYFQQALAEGEKNAAFYIGEIHFRNIPYTDAEKYYKIAYDNGNMNAALPLGIISFGQIEGNFPTDLLLSAYNVETGVKKGIAAMLLGVANHDLGNKLQAQKYLLEAVKLGNNFAGAELFNILVTENGESITNHIDLAENYLYSLEANTDDTAFLENQTITILLAEKQYYFVKQFFDDHEEQSYKDRFKPAYYATMYYLKDEYPTEYQKAGPELQETIQEFIDSVEATRKEIAEVRKKNKAKKKPKS